ERRRPERLPEHDAGARNRGDEHALEKPRLAILDDGDRREDRGEEQHQDDDAGIEVLEGADRRAGRWRPEGGAEAATEEDPEDQRLRERPHEPAALPNEPQDLAPPQRADARHTRPAHAVAPSPAASSVQKRWPVTCTNTSSSVGLPNVTVWMSLGNASTTSRTNSWPRGSSIRSAPSMRRGSQPNRWRIRSRRRSGSPLCTTTTSPPIARFSSAGVPTATRAPRCTTPMRSQRSASSIAWVVRTTVTPSVSRSRTSWPKKSRRAPGSSPVLGSSRSSNSGPWSSPFASSTRRASPPDSVSTRSSDRS